MVAHYSLHSEHAFTLEGQGSLYDYLSYQHNFFKVDQISSSVESQLHVTVGSPIDVDVVNQLSDDNRSYTRSSDNSFVMSIFGQSVQMNGGLSIRDQAQILFDRSFDRSSANHILDLIWRLRWSAKDVCLVHAACVSKDGRATLLPSWKGVGKTAYCINLARAGWDFLGDDKVWMCSSGEVLAYPRYVVIKDSNLQFFPEVRSWCDHIKLFVQPYIRGLTGGRFIQLMRYVLNRIFRIKVRYFRVEELAPNAKTLLVSKLESAVFLEKKRGTVKANVSDYSADKLASKMDCIHNAEWNLSLLAVANMHDLLFPEAPRWVDEILALMRKEHSIIQSALARLPGFRAEIPYQQKEIDCQFLMDGWLQR